MLEGQQLTRRIQLGQGISSVGDGIWFTTWAIYLTQVLGFPAAVMGAAVGIGGLTGVGLAFPGGMAADRYGSRNTLIVLTAIRGLAMLGFCFVGNAWTLFPVTIGYFGTGSAVSGVWTTLVCELFEGEDQMGALARLRVVQHAGYAAGSGLGAGVLALNQKWAFTAAIAVNAATFLVLLVIVASLPQTRRSISNRVGSSLTVLKNYPYAVTMMTVAMLATCWAVLSTGVPLWVSTRTTAPNWLSAVIVVLSSLLIATFQVRVTRDVRSIDLAGRAGRFSGGLLAACCVPFAASSWFQTWLASLLLLIAGLLHVAGELYFVAARWGLSIGLMDHSSKGQYQGVAATTEATVQAVAPALVAVAITLPGITGWVLLAGLFATAGLAVPSVAGWARRQKAHAC